MSKLNPQKATAYVGPGVLRKGGKITPVPNGPLIKKKGPYAGSTFKSGGKIKKAQGGEYLTKEGNKYTATKKVKTKNGPRYYQGSSPSMSFAREIASNKALGVNDSIPKAKLSARALEIMNKKNGGIMKKKAQQGVKIGNTTYNFTNVKDDPKKKVYVNNPIKDTTSAPKVTASDRMNKIINTANKTVKKRKAGGAIKKAQLGGLIRKAAKTVIKKTPKKITRFSSEAERIGAGQKPNLQKAKESVNSLDDSKVTGSKESYSKKGLRMAVERRTNPEIAKKKMTKAQREKFDLERSYYKNGGMLKRADGSYSKRGLWDNIRANKGSGKKPTAEMLKQERKIKAKSKK
jgi:hypothetical protein